MTRLAMTFPGQGSQSAGMARHLADAYPAVVAGYFRRADDILGRPISSLCLDAGGDTLRQTDIAQPAILVVSLAVLDVLRSHGVEPDMAAGHSLGEYGALVCAGALGVDDAIRLVGRRGELMAAVDRQSAGAMAAVIGLPAPVVAEVCARVRTSVGVVDCANYNTPDQTVISGAAAAVDAAADRMRAAGARRVVRLPVGGAFHSSLMAAVADEFAVALAAADISAPSIPVFANVTASVVGTPDEVSDALLRQLTGPVRWEETVTRMVGLGVDVFVEVGPGRVLTGLSPQIAPEVEAAATGDERRLSAVLSALAHVGA